MKEAIIVYYFEGEVKRRKQREPTAISTCRSITVTNKALMDTDIANVPDSSANAAVPAGFCRGAVH
jgi:hypothetical protein